MNSKYLKEIYEENKKVFNKCGLDICSSEDLKDFIVYEMNSNFQFELILI